MTNQTNESGGSMRTIQHVIGGKATGADAERFGPVFDPATGVQTGRVALATVAEVDRAVATAKEAFGEWREVSLARRSSVLFAFRELVHRHQAELAAIRA